jgi:hypothetical protein
VADEAVVPLPQPLQLDRRRAYPAQQREGGVALILLIEFVMMNLPLLATKESLSPEQLYLRQHLVHKEMLLWPEDVHNTLFHLEMHLSLADNLKQI